MSKRETIFLVLFLPQLQWEILLFVEVLALLPSHFYINTKTHSHNVFLVPNLEN